MKNAIVQNFRKWHFNKAINLNKLQSLLTERYVKVCTGKFNTKNDQNIYFTSNLHKMLENLLMLIQRKQIYFWLEAIDLFVWGSISIKVNSQTPACVRRKKHAIETYTLYLIFSGVLLTKEYAGEDFSCYLVYCYKLLKSKI